MNKALVNKIIIPAVLGVGLLVGGCSSVLDTLPKFAQPGYHRDAKEREIREEGRIMKYNFYCEENGECYPRQNYAYFKDGEWHPVKGWTWANPDNPRDRRVKKIEETKK